MSRIFISYRRADTRWPTGRLYDHLTARFGPGSVFIDVATIQPGDDFVVAIERAIQQSSILLAVIGPSWLEPGAGGRPRLEDPLDFVRLEIAQAFQHDLRVIPVLVDEATMPDSHQLPADLVPLARRQALRIRNESFHVDLNRLIKAIERAMQVESQVVVAGHWIDDEERFPTYFRQVRDRVVGFYGMDAMPKLGVYYGQVNGYTCDLVWRWLDGTQHGTARVRVTDDAETLELAHVVEDMHTLEENTRTFHFCSDVMPTWLSEADFEPYRDFLYGGDMP